MPREVEVRGGVISSTGGAGAASARCAAAAATPARSSVGARLPLGEHALQQGDRRPRGVLADEDARPPPSTTSAEPMSSSTTALRAAAGLA